MQNFLVKLSFLHIATSKRKNVLVSSTDQDAARVQNDSHLRWHVGPKEAPLASFFFRTRKKQAPFSG